MQTIEIKNLDGNILFSHSEEENSIKKTLEKAVREGVNLIGADLQGANLERANLHGANLQVAYLQRADLERANLERANLQGANLYRAYLERANLERANLQGANLYRAYLEGAYLQGAIDENGNEITKFINIQGSNYHIFWREHTNIIKIGCIEHPIKTWLEKFEEIGIEHNYSKTEIEEYGHYINLINNIHFKLHGRSGFIQFIHKIFGK